MSLRSFFRYVRFVVEVSRVAQAEREATLRALVEYGQPFNLSETGTKRINNQTLASHTAFQHKFTRLVPKTLIVGCPSFPAFLCWRCYKYFRRTERIPVFAGCSNVRRQVCCCCWEHKQGKARGRSESASQSAAPPRIIGGGAGRCGSCC